MELGRCCQLGSNNKTSECVECLPCAKYFTKISSSNLWERKKSKQKDQRE